MKNRAENWILGITTFDQCMVALMLAATWRFDIDPGGPALFVLLMQVPLWPYLNRCFGLYDSHRLEDWSGVAGRIFAASVAGFALTAGALTLVGSISRLPEIARFSTVLMLVSLSFRTVMYAALRTVRRRGVDKRYVCVIGTWESATEMAAQFRQRPEWGLEINLVGIGKAAERKFYRFPAGAAGSDEVGTDLEEVYRNEVIDELLIISRPEDIADEHKAIHFCKQYGVQCRARLLADELISTPVEYLSDRMTWTVNEDQSNQAGLQVKRLLDAAVSAIMLLLLSPVFILLAIVVKLSSPGPVFFRQTRIGLRGRKFQLYKFRTMVNGAESMLHLLAHRNITGGPIFKDSNDLRVTDVGRVLRRFSLDELPQLLNVLKGEMSLVGPRPLPVHESVAIQGVYRKRFTMKPGITCRWQVTGRNNITFDRWMELDIEYVDNWSLTEDLKLLLLTIPAVFSGRGAY